MAGVSHRHLAVRLACRLREAGHEALLAGGCVRDRLRGVEPEDYDLATSARPDEVQALFAETVLVGAAFGVVLVREEGHSFEVATFREDIGVLDGRHPARVRYADAEADARRRDFTVNGMFEDPETGAILDFVGGQQDLAARLVRAIGEPARRFREDRLRLLRAIRFATMLDFCIERSTMAAVRAQAPAIAEVSAERVRDELTRLLLSGRGGRGLGLLQEAGLLAVILPEVAALDGIPQPAKFHPEGDVLTHTRMLLDGYREGGEAVVLAALLHDVAKAPTVTINEKGRLSYPMHAELGAEMAGRILRRLRFPGRLVAQVETLIAQHMVWPVLPKMREAKRRRFLLRDDFAQHLELHRLDVEACHRDLSVHAFAREERRRLDAEPPPVRPLLDGHDLKALGFVPGPAFRRMLEALVDAQLEGTVGDAERARSFVRARFRPPDGEPVAGAGGR
ncbi:MAG: CCA tRNA nucleotidyltransferase [Planctomycetota bacterium]|jgi:poly(A) polymerase